MGSAGAAGETATTGETAAAKGSPALGLQLFFQKLFAQLSGAGAASPVEAESEAHTQAAGEALDQARGGGPANGQLIEENGKIVRQVSGADPTARNYWLRVNGPNGEELVGADTQEILTNFFTENPQFKAASRIFEAGDVQEIAVEGERMPGIVRFGSGLMNGVRGAIIEPGYLAVDVVDWFMHKATGRARPFEPWSGLWNATNSYKSRGHSYPGAIFNVVADGAFYGTIGAVLGIDEASKDGDWYSIGQHTFALGATVAGAALGGVRAGMAAPTTRSALLGGIAIESSEATTMMMARRAVTTSEVSEVQRALDNPLILRGPGGIRPRGVFFGDDAGDLMMQVGGWMDDGILQDALHIGGPHGNWSNSDFTLAVGGTEYLISPEQLASAVNRAVPGTTLTYDHLLICCGTRTQTGGAFAYARARLGNRLLLGYEEPVGVHEYGRYSGYEIIDPSTSRLVPTPYPSQYQYMNLLDPSGTPIGIHPFRGMRGSGNAVP